MMEIVCPSCEARYRLPAAAIGESGRRVSCSACGHAWLAYPSRGHTPLKLEPEASSSDESASDEKTTADRRPPAAVRATTPQAASNGDRKPAGRHSEKPASQSAFAAEKQSAPSAGQREMDKRLADDRTKQMAQIRSMLNEIKTEPDADAADNDRGGSPRGKSGANDTGQERSEEDRDPLREKLEHYKRFGGRTVEARTSRPGGENEDEDKERPGRDERRGAGTALTGFLLVVFVVSIMAAVYLLHPLIIARVPEAEPALRDYVATMDAFRLWLGEQVAALQAVIEGLIPDE